MVDITSINFSNDLVNKLKSKDVESLTEFEAGVVNSIGNGENVLMQHGVSTIILEACAVNQGESIKKLKNQRLMRVLVCTDNADKAAKVFETIKNLVTKDLSIVLCSESIKMKKNKINLNGAVDIVVGTISRITELIKSKTIKTDSLKQAYCLSFLDECSTSLSVLLKFFDKNVQKILTCSEVTPECESFLKDVKGNFQKFQSTSSTISEASSSEEEENVEKKSDTNESLENEEEPESKNHKNIDDSEEDEDEKKSINTNESEEEGLEVNGSSKEIESPEFEEKSEQNGIANEIERKDNSEESDAVIIDRVSRVKKFEHNMVNAKILLEKNDTMELVAKLVTMCQGYRTKDKVPNKVVNKTVPSKPGFTGDNVSRYSGREGFTAYHFRTNRECYSNGYAFKSMKRLIDEDLVERISLLKMEKDSMGFVFDLPSEINDSFQSKWKDGKYDTLCLLEGDIPELIDVGSRFTDANRGGRGGFRGGRGGNRGGHGENRGGRGGFKRPGGNSLDRSKPKVQKF